MKVVAPLLHALPDKHRYKVVFMIRPVAEVVASQIVLLQNRGSAPRATPGHLQTLQEEQVERCLTFLRAHAGIELLEVPYPDLVVDPEKWAEALARFLGTAVLPTAAAMAGRVHPPLYRHRLG